MLIRETIGLLRKEFTLEIRQKYAINGILLYVISTIFISYLAFKNVIAPSTWNALFWTIMLFSSVNAISKSFIQESRGRWLYLFTLASPQAVILSKIIYNILLISLLSIICLGAYSLFIGNIIQNNLLFFITLLLGSCGISGALTLVSAITSKANNNFSLMAILSFPILVPLLISLIKVSGNAIDGLEWSVSYVPLLVLSLLNLIIFVLAYLLFPYLWKD